MRFFAYLGLAALSLVPLAAQAADISESSAKAIEAQIDRLLPIAYRQILKISAARDHYEALLNFEPALPNFERPVRISEITPVIGMLKPRADGLWNVTAQGKDAWAIGDYFFGEQPSHFQLHLGGYDLGAVLDPATKTPREINVSITDLDLSNRAYLDTLTSSAKSYDVKASMSELKGGTIDCYIDLETKDLRQVQRLPEFPDPLTFWGKSASERASVKGMNIEGVQRLLLAMTNDGADGGKITDIPWQQLAAVLRDHPLLFESAQETGTMQSAGLSFRDIKVEFESLAYELAARGTPKDNAFAFSLSAHHPSLQPGRFAAGIEAAMPEDTSVGFELSGMDLQAAVLAAANRAPSATADERKVAFQQALLPNQRMRMEIRNTFARSRYYDIAATGWLALNPLDDKDGEADLTVTARDIDKTVAFLQANANTVPDFGQASFMLLMAKGFGKQEQDGTMTWRIQADASRKFLVNGREIPH